MHCRNSKKVPSKHNKVTSQLIHYVSTLTYNHIYIQQPWWKVSDESHFGSVCHFLAVNFKDKDAPTNVARKRWYQTKMAEPNISSFLRKHPEWSVTLEDIFSPRGFNQKNYVFNHAPKMHQSFLLTASPAQGRRSCASYQRRLKDEGGVSLWTSYQSITGTTHWDKQPPTRVGI